MVLVNGIYNIHAKHSRQLSNPQICACWINDLNNLIQSTPRNTCHLVCFSQERCVIAFIRFRCTAWRRWNIAGPPCRRWRGSVIKCMSVLNRDGVFWEKIRVLHTWTQGKIHARVLTRANRIGLTAYFSVITTFKVKSR